MRAAILRAAGTGHGAGYEDLTVHRERHRNSSHPDAAAIIAPLAANCFTFYE
jgi:hypothetical protein